MIQDFKNIQSTKKDLKNFGLLVGGIFSLIGIYLFYKHHSHYAFLVLFGLILVIFGLIAPIILKPLHKVWMGLALILNYIVTHIILILLFYLCITPLAIIARLVGKKFLNTSFKEDHVSETCWKMKGTQNKDQLEKQF